MILRVRSAVLVRRVPRLTSLALFALSSIGLFGACSSSAPPGDGEEEKNSPDPPECDEDRECDDGNPCNGDEFCEAVDGTRRCSSGDAVDCDRDETCDRATGRCLAEGCDADGDGSDSVACGGDDCDDSDSNRYPGNTEQCLDSDGLPIPSVAEHDEDCDPSTLGGDEDGDGFYGDACANEEEDGDLVFGVDCDDQNPLRNPFFDEICDGLDNDCVGGLDYPGEDDDGDGFADCADLDDQAQFDCDDSDPARYPGAPELCDGIDQNCDGNVEDRDEDGFVASDEACSGGPLPGGDCDDEEPLAFPQEDEWCDGIDTNCSGTVDDGNAVSMTCGDNQTNGAPACIEGACGVLCDDDYGNCDGNLGSGCETFLPTSLRNCGACGNVCAIDCTANTCLEAWVAQWGTNKDDEVGDIVVDADGNTWVAWISSEAVVTKFDTAGKELFTKPLVGGEGLDVFLDIDAGGNIYGASVSAGEILLQKLGSDGEPIWLETIQVASFGGLKGLAVSGAGEAYLIGSVDAGGAFTDAFVSKVDVSGSFLETVTWGTDASDIVSDIAVSSSGDVYVTGKTEGEFSGQMAQGQEDVFLSALDDGLSPIWTVQWGTINDDEGVAVAVDAEQSLYVVCETNGDMGNKRGATDAVVTKLSDQGQILWTTQWGSSFADDPSDIAVDSQGRAVVVGSTFGDLDGGGRRGEGDAFLTFFDQAGSVVRTEQWGTSAQDNAFRVFSDAMGNAFVSGTTQGDLDGEGNTNSAPPLSEGLKDIFALRLDR